MQAYPAVPLGTEQRLHALDAARAIALMGGIALHGVMSFMPAQIGWPMSDVSQGPGASVIFFVIHVFRMTAFFLMAGFFARLALGKKGVGRFILDRVKRIGIPMVVGWPILMAAILGCYVWGFGIVYPDGPPPGAAEARAAAAANAPPLAFPLTHLWFLWDLILAYVVSLPLAGLVVLIDRGGHLRRAVDGLIGLLVRSNLAPFVLAAPLFAALVWGVPEWRMWFGIPTPDNALVPNLAAAAGFGTAFVFGWQLHRNLDLLQVWTRRWALNLVVAAALVAGCLAMLGLTPVTDSAPIGQDRMAFAAVFTLAVWFSVQAFVGLALRFLDRPNAAIRYLADASYWMYLVHLPLVMALQIAVGRIPVAWFIKFPLVLVVATALMLLSYEYLVRYSFIGTILNGRRRRPAKVALQGVPQPA